MIVLDVLRMNFFSKNENEVFRRYEKKKGNIEKQVGLSANLFFDICLCLSVVDTCFICFSFGQSAISNDTIDAFSINSMSNIDVVIVEKNYHALFYRFTFVVYV